MKNGKEVRESYGYSSKGNFSVMDTIGVPHPFCITPKHVVHASDHCCGMLGKESMNAAPCGMRFRGGGRCQLSADEHETALLVACKADMKGVDGKVNPELHEYLLSIKDQATQDGFVGFSFLDKR